LVFSVADNTPKNSILHHLLPFTEWLSVRPDRLKADAMTGRTVALVLILQSMTYARLAGLPAYYGLYAAFLPPVTASEDRLEKEN
jgi:SulP family sulfate permease